MKSPSSPSVHNRRHEKHSHRKSMALRVLLAVAGAMILTLGMAAATESSGASSNQAHERAFDSDVELGLVDFRPFDTDDQSAERDSTRDSDNRASTREELDAPEQAGSSDGVAPFFYENCDAARAAGAAPVLEGDPGFGPHLDRDDDGIGCEVPGTADAQPLYENCDAARAAGAAPVLEGDPGFGPHLDRDSDGIGCEMPYTDVQPPAESSGETSVYENCDAARAAGAAPVLEGDPGFGPHLDRDSDGIGCE